MIMGFLDKINSMINPDAHRPDDLKREIQFYKTQYVSFSKYQLKARLAYQLPEAEKIAINELLYGVGIIGTAAPLISSLNDTLKGASSIAETFKKFTGQAYNQGDNAMFYPDDYHRHYYQPSPEYYPTPEETQAGEGETSEATEEEIYNGEPETTTDNEGVETGRKFMNSAGNAEDSGEEDTGISEENSEEDAGEEEEEEEEEDDDDDLLNFFD